MKRKSARKQERNKRIRIQDTRPLKRKFVDDDGNPVLRKKGAGDWSLPGYNYLGPGNPTNDGYLPTDEDDRLSMEHDDKYGDIERSGQNPYLKYGEDDEKVYEKFGHGYGGYLGKAWFGLKKHVWGGKVNEQKVNAKRIADRMEQKTVNREKMRAESERKYGEEVEKNKKFTKEHPLDVRSLPIFSDSAQMTKPSDERVHVIPDDDMGQSPAMNLGTVAGRSAGTGVLNGGETAVDMVTDEVLRPWRVTQNTILPWYGGPYSTTLAIGATETAVKTFGFRLNSCYDLLSNSTYTEDPAAAADTADASKEVPIMREYWQNFYLYWTVTRMQYKVRLWTENKTDQEVDIWCYHHGQQTPPLANDGATGTVLYSKYRKLHQNCHMKVLKSRGANMTEFNSLENGVTFTGSYKPGDINNEVSEDAYHEIWHKPTQVPSMREVCSFFVQRSERSPSTATIEIKYDIELVYHVQWKDLKAKFQYMTPTVDATLTNFANSTTQ